MQNFRWLQQDCIFNSIPSYYPHSNVISIRIRMSWLLADQVRKKLFQFYHLLNHYDDLIGGGVGRFFNDSRLPLGSTVNETVWTVLVVVLISAPWKWNSLVEDQRNFSQHFWILTVEFLGPVPKNSIFETCCKFRNIDQDFFGPGQYC